MGGGAWQATVHGVAKSQTRLRDFTFIFQAFLGLTASQVHLTHTPLFPVDKVDGMNTKFSFITSSSKSSIGYSFRCSKETEG